jgi:hypothetical protein
MWEGLLFGRTKYCAVLQEEMNERRRNFGRITNSFILGLLLFEGNQKIITPKSMESKGVLVAREG